MKIEDLRIGNYVTTLKANNLSRVNNIFGASGLVDCVEVASGMPHFRLSLLLFCKPIQLTPEILEKCGFAYARKNSSVLQFKIAYNDSDYPCSLQVSGSGIQICRSGIGAICAPIEYLHQLQNLYYALTGTELEIKL